MFFFRVLDLVVADPVQALHKHYDGGNAGPSYFSGVVDRTGGKPMRHGAGFGSRFIAERDQIVVEENRLDLPEAFP